MVSANPDWTQRFADCCDRITTLTRTPRRTMTITMRAKMMTTTGAKMTMTRLHLRRGQPVVDQQGFSSALLLAGVHEAMRHKLSRRR